MRTLSFLPKNSRVHRILGKVHRLAVDAPLPPGESPGGLFDDDELPFPLREGGESNRHGSKNWGEEASPCHAQHVTRRSANSTEALYIHAHCAKGSLDSSCLRTWCIVWQQQRLGVSSCCLLLSAHLFALLASGSAPRSQSPARSRCLKGS
jgi:hypothetical protein